MRLLKVLAGVLIAFILSAGISYAQYSPTAKQITVDTSGYTKLNNTKTNVKDVLSDIDSKINTASSLTGQVPLENGGTGLSSASDDTTIISNGTAWQSKTIPSCTDSGGNHLNYDQSSNSFSCGSSGATQGEDSTTIFNVKTEYGAKGDGIQLYDGTITSGTPNFTSATASFTSSDVGKVITITGAGGTNIDLTTTISNFVSSTAVTLANNASASVSGVTFCYGTDDTTAINNAITAVYSANPPVGNIFFPSGIYIVNGAYTGNNGSQLSLPDVPVNVDSAQDQQTLIKMSGPFYNKSTNGYRYASGGAIIYSTRQGAVGNSIISGKSTAGASNLTDIRVDLENLTFRTVQNPVNSAINFKWLNTAILDGVYIEAGMVTINSIVQPTTSTSYGLYLPGTQNNNTVHVTRVRVQGFYTGIYVGEHSYLDKVSVFYAVNGLDFSPSVHSAYGGEISIERTINNIVCNNTASFVFDLVDMENAGSSSSSWYQNIYDFYDPANKCTGSMAYFIQGTEGGSETFTYSGAKTVSFISADIGKFDWKTQTTANTMNIIYTSADSTTGGAFLGIIQDDNTALASGNRIGGIFWAGSYDTSGLPTSRNFGASIYGYANQTYTASAAGTYLRFDTAPDGSTTKTEKMRILANGGVLITPPASQTISAGSIITDNGCGTIKQITSAGAVTTDTTNTFTAPSGGNQGCCMEIINVGANNITLDNNANFVSAGAADVVMTANDAVKVCSTGASGKWYQVTPLEAN